MVDAKGFFIGTCQYNFGTSPHAQCALVGIQCFSREFLALLQYEFIQIGQDGGVKADAVFHQQDELHTHFVDVVLQVHLVLYQLDDGTSKSVFPSQQNTYSKGLRSSLAIRLVMPWLKGVSITIGICSYRF